MSISALRNWVAVLVIMTGSSTPAGTIIVPTDQPTIQAGIDAALEFDTVLVTPGIYTGDGNRNISTRGKQIAVIGQYGSDSTIIDVQSDTIDGFRNEFLLEDTSTIIRGITIRNARHGISLHVSYPLLIDVTCENNALSGLYWSGQDGRIRIDSSTFRNNNIGIHLANVYQPAGIIGHCNISSNTSAGILYQGVTRKDKSGAEFDMATQYEQSEGVEIDSCVLDSNGTGIDFIERGIMTMSGGRLSENTVAFGGGVDVTDCTIARNGSVAALGYRQYLRLTDCEVLDNNGPIAALDGLDHDPAWLDMYRTRVIGNAGGIFAPPNTRLVMDSCLYLRNGSPLKVITDGDSRITRSTIVDNDSGAIVIQPGPGNDITVVISENIICNNREFGILDSMFYPVPYSCNDLFANDSNYIGLNNPVDTNGNFSADPLFCDTSIGDYSLLDVSPCLSAVNPCSTLIGAYDEGCASTPWLDTFYIFFEAVTNVVSHTPEFVWHYNSPADLPQDSFEVEVDTDGDWTEVDMWDPAVAASDSAVVTYAGDSLIDGATYNARVRAHNGYAWSAWMYLTFRMNSIPGPSEPVAPSAQKVDLSRPILSAVESTDPDNDLPAYVFEVYADRSLDSIVSASDSAGVANHSWQVVDQLTENAMYWWRVRVFDGFEFSAWSDSTWFQIDALQESPSALSCQYPPASDDSILFEMQPIFRWSEAVDPDPFDTVVYSLVVSLDSTFEFTNRVDFIVEPEYPWGSSLRFGEQYWWRVIAFDQAGDSTVSSNTPSFWTWQLGDITRDHVCDISDLTTLVDHLFVTFEPIEPFKTGDVTGECEVDISDLTRLVGHLFGEGISLEVGCGAQ